LHISKTQSIKYVFSHIYTGDEMSTVNVTIALPEGLHKKMKMHDEISWSAVIRNMIEQRLKDLELLDRLTKKSTLTDSDVEKLAEKIDRSVAKKLGIA
jgi:predicted CopG family antitoxin